MSWNLEEKKIVNANLKKNVTLSRTATADVKENTNTKQHQTLPDF